MRYQIRLMDQNLPGLTREIALACWQAVDLLLPEESGKRLYRKLYRAVRHVLRSRVQAFRYCGAARVCEHSLPPAELARTPKHERFPGEHVHVYLTGPETPPEALIHEILKEALRAVVERFPRRPLHVVGPALRGVIEEILKDRMFRSERCGEDSLCHMNEPYDPWDLTDPINAVEHRA